MLRDPGSHTSVNRNPVLRFIHFSRRTTDLWVPVVWILGLSAAIGLVDWFILHSYVEKAVDKRIYSQQTLENISARIRPYALIDVPLNGSSATFQYDDHGAFSRTVDAIDFRQSEPGSSAILTFKMKNCVRLPLVQPLTAGIYVYSFWQTNKFDWAFQIQAAPIAISHSKLANFGKNQSLPSHCKFFVELLTDKTTDLAATHGDQKSTYIVTTITDFIFSEATLHDLMGGLLGFVIGVIWANWQWKRDRIAQAKLLRRNLVKGFRFNLDRIQQCLDYLQSPQTIIPNFRLDTSSVGYILFTGRGLFPNESWFDRFNWQRYQLEHINAKMDYIQLSLGSSDPRHADLGRQQFGSLLHHLKITQKEILEMISDYEKAT